MEWGGALIRSLIQDLERTMAEKDEMTNKLEKDRDERARDKGRMAEVEKGSQIPMGEGKLFEAVEEKKWQDQAPSKQNATML